MGWEKLVLLRTQEYLAGEKDSELVRARRLVPDIAHAPMPYRRDLPYAGDYLQQKEQVSH